MNITSLYSVIIIVIIIHIRHRKELWRLTLKRATLKKSMCSSTWCALFISKLLKRGFTIFAGEFVDFDLIVYIYTKEWQQFWNRTSWIILSCSHLFAIGICDFLFICKSLLSWQVHSTWTAGVNAYTKVNEHHQTWTFGPAKQSTCKLNGNASFHSRRK